MPYIGKSPEFGVRNRFIFAATAGQTTFSGSDANGITLKYVDTAYLDVFQNGVLLKAATDYTAATGTSVVLTTGASADDVVSMLVYDVFTVGDTVSAANGGSFGGAVSMASTLNVTGAFTSPGIDDNASATALNIDSNGQVGLTGSTTAFDTTGAVNGLQLYYESDSGISTIGPYSNGGNTSLSLHTNSGGGASAEAMNITSSGEITKPLQPAFLAKPTSDQTNHALNSYVDVVFGTEIFDLGSNFASNTFTAPVTGKYQLNAGIYVQNLDEAAGYYIVTVTTSNRTTFQILDPRSLDQDAVYWSLQVAVLADMDANDTAKSQVYQNAGTQQTDINANSYFSGFLAC